MQKTVPRIQPRSFTEVVVQFDIELHAVVARQDDVSIVLMAVPGPPIMDEATRSQVLNLVAKGFAGTVFLTTENCRATYEKLKARGVEFTEEPHEMPYGIDCGFRDPSGNSVRLTQVADAYV